MYIVQTWETHRKQKHSEHIEVKSRADEVDYHVILDCQ